MGNNRKTVFKGFGYLQCDDFAAYLTEMAAKGWHFKEWGAGLVFEKGTPERVQYAVEVFINGSEYDTRPDVHTREFAEYCEAAGWQLIDAKRKFVIFKKVRPDADDILTPQERLENIAKEERKDILQKIALSYTWNLLQLLQFTGSGFVNRIFSNGLLMISAIWFALALCATVRGVHYLIWKKKWTKMVDNGEEIYFGLKKNIFSFTNGWYSWLSTGILLVFLASLALSQQYLTLVFAVIFSAPIVVMGYLIARFRPDAGTNQIIQIVVSMALVIIVLIFSVVIIFTDDTTTEDEQAIPLYYEDIGGEAGEIIKAEVDQSSSIFGSGMRCWIEYEDEYVYYYVYTSDHAWIIDTIWEDRVVQKYNQTGEDVSDLWGAVAAIRNTIGGYLVKYPDAVLILDFAEDTVLSQSDAEIIRAALLEGR